MKQDLRNLLKTDRDTRSYTMPKDHENRFLEKLNREMPVAPNKKFGYKKWAIAASVLFFVGLATIFFVRKTKIIEVAPSIVNVAPANKVSKKEVPLSLGDLSPEFKKIENYYQNTIHMTLAQIPVTDSTKDLVDSYLAQLEILNQEYGALQEDLNSFGANDETITAMIQNLQLRAQLLQKLNKKLHQLNTSKNEQLSVM